MIPFLPLAHRSILARAMVWILYRHCGDVPPRQQTLHFLRDSVADFSSFGNWAWLGRCVAQGRGSE